MNDPTKPPHGGASTPQPLDPTGPGTLDRAALEVAVHHYLVVNRLGPPIDAAAFGVACGELMMALNVSLNVAALLLRTELDRRGV